MTKRWFALTALLALVAGSVVISACGPKAKPPAAVPTTSQAPSVLSMSLEAKSPPEASIASVAHDARGPVKVGDRVGITAKAAVPFGSRLVAVVGGQSVALSAGSSPDSFSGAMTVPDVAPSRYPLEARILDANGKELARRQGPELIVAPPPDPKAELAKALEGLRVPFDYDSAALSASAKGVLEQIAETIRKSGLTGLTLCVGGHCDQRGTVQYNIALGDRRAKTAAQYLGTLLGANAGASLKPVSFGNQQPLDPGQTEAAYAANRRAEVHVDACK